MIFLFPLFLVLILHVPGAASIPGISGPSNLASPSKRRFGVTKANRHMVLNGTFLNLRKDWLVNLRFPNKFVDITYNSFLLEFNEKAVKGCNLTLVFEAGAVGNTSFFKVNLPIAQSNTKMIVIPSLYFPRDSLSQGHRLGFLVPSCCKHYKRVTMINTPPNAEVARHKFYFEYWKFINALRNRSWPGNQFTLNLNTSSYFEYAYDKIMRASPSELGNPLHVSGIDANFVAGDGCADPRAKLITAISRDLVNASSGLLVGSSPGGRLIQMVPRSSTSLGHFKTHKYLRFVGRIIGIAVANRLPLDVSFSSEILQAILNGNKKSLFHELGKLLRSQADAQVDSEIETLCNGVWDVVPRHYLAMFDQEQLGWLISGCPDLNIDMLKELTVSPDHQLLDTFHHDFSDYMSDGEAEEIALDEKAWFMRVQVLQWFWEYVAKLPQNGIRALVELITDSPNLPPLFHTDEWVILCDLNSDQWPKPADECLPKAEIFGCGPVKQLHIPPYTTQDVLELNFNRALNLKREYNQV